MPMYRIRSGDTLSRIARKFGMTWQQLYEYDGGTDMANQKRLNEQKKAKGRPAKSIDNPNLIYPNDIILVPTTTGRGRFGKAKRVVGRVTKKPFKDIFSGVVRLEPGPKGVQDQSNPPFPWWHQYFHLRIVEAIKDTSLSKIAAFLSDRSISVYDPDVIYLFSREHATWFMQHAVVGDGDSPNFQDFYQRGNVPSNYDEMSFDSDKIYPGQRFFLLTPIKAQVHDDFEPDIIEVKRPSYLKSVWIGLGVATSGDLAVGGYHSYSGKVYNMGDSIGEDLTNVRNAVLSVQGYKGGPGLGGSYAPVVIIAHGFNEADEMAGKTDWSFDFDVTLYSSLSAWLKGFKHIGKAVDTYQKYKKLQYFATNVIKNRFAWEKGIYTLPIPTGPIPSGIHLWVGVKFSNTCTVQWKGKGVP